jgi:hypothetical protein
MKYAIEIISGVMIYTTSFIETGIQKFIEGIQGNSENIVISPSGGRSVGIVRSRTKATELVIS